MSLNTEPNYNTYIDRFADILTRSTLLMPKTNGDDTKEDLVRQIIKYDFPVPESPPEGLGPPHIFIAVSPNVIYRRTNIGRDDRDITGPENVTLEFYIIILAQDRDPVESQKQLFTIIEAVTTTLKKNKRLTDSSNESPLAKTLNYVSVPYLITTEANDIIARNIIVRPDVFVNLRV